MPFDGAMVAACVNELSNRTVGAKIDKVFSPQKDELVLVLRGIHDGLKLSLFASANSPRFNITGITKENPKVPSAFCMHMRKHLCGAKITAVEQPEFERVVKISLSTYDEMGFPVEKYLFCEIMGKCSNIILCDEKLKIINVIKTVDFTTSHKRQLLPGMLYEMPPTQDKKNPLLLSQDDVLTDVRKSVGTTLEKLIMSTYKGFSPILAREASYSASGDTECLITEENCELCAKSVYKLIEKIKNNDMKPVLLCDEKDVPKEYTVFDIKQYGTVYKKYEKGSFGELIDDYFEEKERNIRIHQRATDILKLLTNAEARLKKKISAQKNDLKECEKKDKYKLCGDLIIANIYLIKKGMKSVALPNYYSGDGTEQIQIALDERQTPAQNAQKYYKKYAKAKTAEVELQKQIKIAQAELEYIYTVFESLTKCDGETDINEIREELYNSGYASKMKNYSAKKQTKPQIAKYKTDGGYTVLVGKNNHQNDYITTKLAGKLDYWFHIKGAPGSHVILICGKEEPETKDFTQAAELAAYFSSKKDGENVEVDYTLVKNIKKPSAAKPGFVVYNTNYSAVVTPDAKKIKQMKM